MTPEDERPPAVSNSSSPGPDRTDPPPPPSSGGPVAPPNYSGAPVAPPSSGGTVAPPSAATTTEFATPRGDDRAVANRDANVDMATLRSENERADQRRNAGDWTDKDRTGDLGAERTPVAASPKPRASLLATLGLIFGVASALLVLSGPLLGYGIGVAVLALILSLAGIHATGRRHVAGKTDALIGMVLALGAIVIGVLALTGSLSWAGTDIQPVNSVREWLDTQFANRF
jgi:hypothetical protein